MQVFPDLSMIRRTLLGLLLYATCMSHMSLICPSYVPHACCPCCLRPEQVFEHGAQADQWDHLHSSQTLLQASRIAVKTSFALQD